LSAHGLDALRDATLWGYAAFALIVPACVLRTGAMPDIVRNYSRWVGLCAAWLPIALAIKRFMGEAIPNLPGTDVAIISTKPGDGAVHLAGAATFVLLGLYESAAGADSRRRDTPRLFWPLWLLSLVFVAALNRGGFLSVVAALAIVGATRPIVIGRRVAAAAVMLSIAAAVILPISATFETVDPASDESAQRAISPGQVTENVLSIGGGKSDARGNLSNTREWRLEWWQSIVDYTLFGPYFWSGKGFGVNLADDDGFQVAQADEAQLRSPHNVHMTFLARMGVPGAVAWVGFLLCFAVSLLRGFLRARRTGDRWWAHLHLWILSYWVAFLVNASFDVFLEGPQGGIWFWCVTGLGIATIDAYKRQAAGTRFRQVRS
jgi:hypothetical protein